MQSISLPASSGHSKAKLQSGPLGAPATGGTMTTENRTAYAPRQFSVWLIVGIVLMPYLFAWLTLRSGYSSTSRFASFAWMTVLVVALMADHNTTPGTSSASPSSAASSSSAPAPANDVALSGGFVAKMVKGRLTDPDSARFSNVTAYSSGEKLTYCGEVNSKNRMGGYAGPTPFIVADSGIFIGESATADRLATECHGQMTTEVKFFDGK